MVLSLALGQGVEGFLCLAWWLCLRAAVDRGRCGNLSRPSPLTPIHLIAVHTAGWRALSDGQGTGREKVTQKLEDAEITSGVTSDLPVM